MKNKESVTKNFKIDEEKCIKCGLCVKDCVVSAITMEEYPKLDDKTCFECGHCLTICPTGALSILGKKADDSTILIDNLPSAEQMKVLIKGRRSIRQYSNENLPTETLQELFNTIAYAPTGVNSRSVHHTIIDNKDTMDAFRNEVYKQLEDVLVKIDYEGKNNENKHALEILNIAIKKRKENGTDIIFRGAPHMVIASAPNDSPSPEADTIIALSYLDLMAQTMGIGTLWNGIAKMALVCLPDLAERIGVPSNHHFGYVMVFGKASVKYKRTVEHGSPNMKIVNCKFD